MRELRGIRERIPRRTEQGLKMPAGKQASAKKKH
jgi:hypothetical protein